ncbi:putative glycosyltransferase [Sulfolobales Beppu filamentous virus 2]|uniref:Putative glycosyltransferase n=1 Tax=Sulfolobales Beppu filamentous virus 2 TaxID=2493123 RepID=A0A3Q8Q3T2_9VIRU|nr:putative glycosyltransferase [Sulfolobales Beppu filamentous virus 2]AZI75824.1 putative glycosyltransferase [Sulfolobales Beppu filamentous virus 2]
MLLCVPLGWITYSEPLVAKIKWAESAGYRIEFHISNRVDLNRSMCINLAKRLKEDLIMMDADVTIENTPNELEEILENDKDADAVIGIAVSKIGILVHPPPPPDVEKFEIDYGSLSFIYLPYKTLEKLKPISTYGMFGEMYMTYTPEYSEDVEFIKRLKKEGLKVIADKRIKVLHWKMLPLSYQEIHFEVHANS